MLSATWFTAYAGDMIYTLTHLGMKPDALEQVQTMFPIDTFEIMVDRVEIKNSTIGQGRPT